MHAGRLESRRAVARNPVALQHLVAQLAARVVEVEEHLAALGVADVRQRLALHLCRLVREAGPSAAGWRVVPGKPTRSLLARQIGVSRESVSRALSALERDGWIHRQGRHIVLPAAEALRQSFV